jgi:hypothetical protein
MDSALVGSRVRFGSAWAKVSRVEGDRVYAVLEGENMLVVLPRVACSASGIATVSERVRAVQRRHMWTETSHRHDHDRRLDRVLLVQASRGASREHRPRRRVARAGSKSGSDPPPESDEPPSESDLARLRGCTAANARLFRHVERRIGSRRAAP